MIGMLEIRTVLRRLCRWAGFFMAEGFPGCIEVLGSQRKGSSVAMELGRSVQGFLMGLLWLPDTACRTEVEARLNFLSSLSWKTFRPFRGASCGTLLCRRGGTLRVEFGGFKAAFGFGEVRSSKDMERPLLALRGRLLWTLTRNECC